MRRIAIKAAVDNLLPSAKPHIDMRDAGEIAFQRHPHMCAGWARQQPVQHLRDHSRAASGIGKIASLHTGIHQHMGIMADQRAVEGSLVKLPQESQIGFNGNPAAAGGLGIVPKKGMDMRGHMLKMAGARRCQFLKAARRGQRPFRCRRHFLNMDVVMQNADMVRASAVQCPPQGCLDFGFPGVMVRRAGIDVIDLPGRQHDLGIDIERGDVGIGAKFVIDAVHGIGIGALPGRHAVVVRHRRLRIADGQRINQRARLGRGSTGTRPCLADSFMTGCQHGGFLRPVQPVPGQVHEWPAGDGNPPPGQCQPFISGSGLAETADGLFMVEAIQPSQPGRKPGGGFFICGEKGRAMRSKVKRIIDLAHLHAPTLI